MAKNNLKIVLKIYIYPSEENFVMELLSITWLLLEFQCQCRTSVIIIIIILIIILIMIINNSHSNND